VTALAEIQSEIAQKLDSAKKVATYSIDMTAAFDLLGPHTFHTINLDPKIMNALMDFMTNRKLVVEVEGKYRKLNQLMLDVSKDLFWSLSFLGSIAKT